MYLKYIFDKSTPQTLGKFLREKGISKQAIISSKHHGGLILVNQKRRYTNFKLKKGDQIFFIAGIEVDNEYLKPNYSEIEIIYENKGYLVVNKPAGLLSIPSRFEDDDSVVNRLLGYFEKTKQFKAKPHVVTRLDKDTSGLMVVAKHSFIHAMFAELGKDIFVKKYQAIVHGNFESEKINGVVEKPILKQGQSVRHWVDQGGKYAKTSYRVLKQTREASLVALRLYTGRTHQIRVHMASEGHELFGDKLYGQKDIMTRQALHAYYLSFIDPISQEKFEFVSQLPKDMVTLWTRLEENYG